ncbi:MAG: hypothetical protein ABIM73_03000 [Arenimonas sp.]
MMGLSIGFPEAHAADGKEHRVGSIAPKSKPRCLTQRRSIKQTVRRIAPYISF